MSIFRKKSEYVGHKSDADVEIESSICTGEKIIGFKNASGKLERAEAVRTPEDIDAFYRRYDLIKSKHFDI